MKMNCFLIKYGEIGVKGSNRYLFEDALVRQIKYALKQAEGVFKVSKTNGRIYVEAESDFDEEETVEALKRVFGILWICPVYKIPDEGFENLQQEVCRFLDETYPEKNFTFKVESRRTRKNYPLDSQEMNRELGACILDTFPTLSVDVHHPDVLLRVEVRETYVNIYSKDIPGPGGMPVPTGIPPGPGISSE